MQIGSHNSWSYIQPIKCWMKLIKFTAKCQAVDIESQYKLGVTCFDLRVKYKNNNYYVSHGLIDYLRFVNIKDCYELYNSLKYINERKNCKVRVIHEIKKEKEYNYITISKFKHICYILKSLFPNIEFFCGRNLVNWQMDYDFGNKDYTIADEYASIKKPNSIYAVWPWLYAKSNNKAIFKQGTDKDILLIDYVNIN